MTKTKINNNKHDNIYIYNVDGVKNKSAAKIKPIGSLFVEKNDTVKDDHIKAINIRENLTGHIFLCNISNTYLVSTKKYPMMYVIVDYYKSLLRCNLFKLYLFFTVTDNIQMEKKLVNNELTGTFSFEVCINNSYKKIDKTIHTYPGKNKMLQNMKDLLKSDTMQSVIDGMINEVEEKRKKKYAHVFTDYKIPVPTISFRNNK
jgi:hypothetical protein